MTKSSGTRLQLELATQHRLLLHVLGEGMGSGGTPRQRGASSTSSKILRTAFVRDTSSPSCRWMTSTRDAVPELTRALRPDLHYSYLVARPHAWRKQLAFKGRRLTVGQFLGRMRAEKWTPEEAAAEFDLPVEAAYEALEYGDRHRSLIAAEDAEDAASCKELDGCGYRWMSVPGPLCETSSQQARPTATC